MQDTCLEAWFKGQCMQGLGRRSGARGRCWRTRVKGGDASRYKGSKVVDGRLPGGAICGTVARVPTRQLPAALQERLWRGNVRVCAMNGASGTTDGSTSDARDTTCSTLGPQVQGTSNSVEHPAACRQKMRLPVTCLDHTADLQPRRQLGSRNGGDLGRGRCLCGWGSHVHCHRAALCGHGRGHCATSAGAARGCCYCGTGGGEEGTTGGLVHSLGDRLHGLPAGRAGAAAGSLTGHWRQAVAGGQCSAAHLLDL